VSTPLPSPRESATALPAPVPAPAPSTLPSTLSATLPATLPATDARTVDLRPPAMALDLDLPPPPEAASTASTTSPVPRFPIVFPDTPIAQIGRPPPVRVTREEIGLVTAVADRPLVSIPPPPPDDHSGEGPDDNGAGAFSSGFTDEKNRLSPLSEEHDAQDAIVSSEDDVAPALRFAAAREDARRAAAVAAGQPVDDPSTRTAVSGPVVDAGNLPTVQPAESLVVDPPPSPRDADSGARTSLAELAVVARALAGADVLGPGTVDGFPPAPVVTDPAAVPFVSDPGVVVTAPEVPALPHRRPPADDVVTAGGPFSAALADSLRDLPSSLPSSLSSSGAADMPPPPVGPAEPTADHARAPGPASDFSSTEASVDVDLATGAKLKKSRNNRKK
jgi:hypothetical protein